MFGVEIKDILLALVTALLGGISFLIRKILTSEKKIAILETALLEMKEERKAHDEKVDDMLTELRYDIKSLLQSRPYPRPKHIDQ